MKKGFFALISLALIIAGIGILFSPSVPTDKGSPSAVKSSDTTEVTNTHPLPQPVINSKSSEGKVAAAKDKSEENLVLVTRVVDGDTIELEGGAKVRYIGINTPETVDPRRPVQCFGEEASAENKKLVEGKKVRLTKDVSERDKYGRLLRYVWLPSDNGKDIFINEFLVKQGYAYADPFPPDVKYEDRLSQDQQYAKENNKGLWSSCY